MFDFFKKLFGGESTCADCQNTEADSNTPTFPEEITATEAPTTFDNATDLVQPNLNMSMSNTEAVEPIVETPVVTETVETPIVTETVEAPVLEETAAIVEPTIETPVVATTDESETPVV